MRELELLNEEAAFLAREIAAVAYLQGRIDANDENDENERKEAYAEKTRKPVEISPSTEEKHTRKEFLFSPKSLLGRLVEEEKNWQSPK